MKRNMVLEKSFRFATRIIKLAQYLQKEKQEYILSKQVFRSGTAIGALIREAQYAESPKDFTHKLTVALKEANETEYWLLLLKEGCYISVVKFESIHPEIKELLKLLISITKSSKTNNKISEEISLYNI